MKKLLKTYEAEGDDESLSPPRPRRELRQGFATGTAAAAAAQGALYELLGRPCPDQVEVSLPGGGEPQHPTPPPQSARRPGGGGGDQGRR